MIGCEDRLRNDLYCVGWGVKLYSNQISRVVTYTVKVAVSKKRCNTDTLLLHTTRQYHVAYRFVPFPVTLKVIRMLHDLSYRCNSTSMCATFRTVSADRARRAVRRRQLSVLFNSSRAVVYSAPYWDTGVICVAIRHEPRPVSRPTKAPVRLVQSRPSRLKKLQ